MFLWSAVIVLSNEMKVLLLKNGSSVELFGAVDYRASSLKSRSKIQPVRVRHYLSPQSKAEETLDDFYPLKKGSNSFR